MEGLTNWDDIIHGTAVFSAAVPFCTALLLAWMLPQRFLWVAIAASLAIPFVWFFGVPEILPKDSDDAMVCGLSLAALLAGAVHLKRGRRWESAGTIASKLICWVVLVWLLYPAWLTDGGEDWKKVLICLGIGATIGGWASLMEFFFREKEEVSARLTLAAIIPPTIALAVLLQLGGALRFGQSAGALAAALGALSLRALWKPVGVGGATTASLWGMLFSWLAWSGWLYVEIHKAAALVLLAAPLLALAVRKIRLPRKNRFQVQLWDGIASALVAGVAVWIAWAEYSANSGGY
jgi:hypothetical protein